MYLWDNPLLERPLVPTDIKRMILGHWGTTPGQNFIYAHLNRVIRRRDLDMIYVCGPGHGGPAVIANTWLEGSWSRVYPEVGEDADGMRTLFRLGPKREVDAHARSWQPWRGYAVLRLWNSLEAASPAPP